MAKRTLTQIINICLQMLRAEFKLSEARDWKKDELEVIANDCIDEISKSCPRIVKETLTTSAGSVKLDTSSITDLMGVKLVEYPVNQNPPVFRNFYRLGDELYMEIDLSPAAGESVNVYCKKPHTLTKSSSTLTRQLENTLIKGICGYAAMNKSQWHIKRINVGGSKVSAQMQNWGLAHLAFFNQGIAGETEAEMGVDYPRD